MPIRWHELIHNLSAIYKGNNIAPLLDAGWLQIEVRKLDFRRKRLTTTHQSALVQQNGRISKSEDNSYISSWSRPITYLNNKQIVSTGIQAAA